MPLYIIAFFIIALSSAYSQTLESNHALYQEMIVKIDADVEAKIELDRSYLTALNNLVEQYRRDVNFDGVKAVMGERGRFDATRTMGETIFYCKDLQERYTARLKQIEAEKTQKKLELSERYVASLRPLLADAMNKGDMGLAERINNEISAVGGIIAGLPTAIKGAAGGGVAGLPNATTEPKGQLANKHLTVKQVVDLFNLAPDAAKNDNLIGLSAGNSDDSNTKYRSKSIVSSSLEFGFEIQAKWYHLIGAVIDGSEYFYSRGHWKNSGLFIVEGTNLRRYRPRNDLAVSDANRFTPMAMKIEKGKITWFYDGKAVDTSPLPVTGKPYNIHLQFASHATELQIRNFYVTGASIP